MDNLTLTCQDVERRQAARDKGLNGIDFIVVCCSDKKIPSLCVHLFGKGLEDIKKTNVRIEGGRRIRDIHVLDVNIEHNDDDPELEYCLRVKLDKFGDLSTYTLRLVEVKDGTQQDEPLAGFDPRYAQAEFSFAVCCSTDLDCKKNNVCPPEVRTEPEIDYLAKDYSSFRQLILDRLALIMPDWKERHIPDSGIALVEVLAYIGDYLSYYQDVVATEAYLDTARQRISVRRHVRLVDYFMHEGCNARTWVFVWTGQNISLDPKEGFFITTPPCLQASGNVLKVEDLNNIAASTYEAFEPLMETEKFQLGEKIPANLVQELLTSQDPAIQYVHSRLSSNTKRLMAAYNGTGKPSVAIQQAVTEDWNRLKTGDLYLFEAHNTIQFYTWGDQECCLPQGAIRATLKDEYVDSKGKDADSSAQIPQQQYKTPPGVEQQRPSKLRLRAGDVLIFEEIKGPQTGNPADADPAHRQAVRLTKVEPGIDHLYDQLIVEIEWATEDALLFPLCISSTLPAPDCTILEDVSVARSNVILVDQGRTADPESLGTVTAEVIVGECDCGRAGDATSKAKRFNPFLKKSPLTFSQKIVAMAPASVMLSQDPRQALPQITLTGLPAANGEPIDPGDLKWKWLPKYDLLESQSQDQNFVVEIDNDELAHLRFGNDELGKMPEANTTFTAVYRVGNGPEGNIGSDAISYLVLRHTTLSGVTLRPRNPLPAQRGALQEPLANIKLFAPRAFRKDLQRAITADDYSSLARNHGKVQNAAAEIQWTGSWYEAEVEIDPLGKEELDDRLRQEMVGYLYRFRRMGQDMVVAPAIYVPLDLTLTVCVLPHYLSGHVEAALLDRFSNRQLPDGQLGFFHPDSLTFGEGIALSKIIAAAQAIPGVESVSKAKLKRFEDSDSLAIADGILKLGLMEIAQLDNDPSFPENGKLTLIIGGGR
jgi:hypothetical protein